MWTKEESNFLVTNIDKMNPDKIAESIGKTERAVRLYMYRHGVLQKSKLKCPLVVKMLSLKFGSPKYFTPDRTWFESVGISQKRFSQLKNGLQQPTDDELKRIAKGINLNVNEMLQFWKSRQLELFD